MGKATANPTISQPVFTASPAPSSPPSGCKLCNHKAADIALNIHDMAELAGCAVFFYWESVLPHRLDFLPVLAADVTVMFLSKPLLQVDDPDLSIVQ